MTPLAKQSKKGLTNGSLTSLQSFINKVKTGEITPFKEKTEQAGKNLKKAGLIQ